ncbi:MAG: NAD(P)/FAD-dependent oxidoreductase [Bacteroidia bacterium]|nr:NAD(P)/FAD-dependent oxidoreductase [Bacteroidia bacterium]
MSKHHQILIIGGGTAGIMVASKIKRERPKVDIGLIDPADTHYYQPAWTLVGAGTFNYKKTARTMSSVIPKGVSWIKDFAVSFDPEKNTVKTETNGDISYDFLVVAPGLVMEPSMIEGLPEALGKGVVCSNYTDPEHTWKVLQNFKGGNAVFTQPGTPIKCGGAPQKTAYLSSDYLRKKGLLDKSNVFFATPGTIIFGVPEIKRTLDKVLDRYGINFRPFHKPIRIDAENQKIYYQYTGKDGLADDDKLGVKVLEDKVVEMHFDMLHLAPPQAAPKFVRESSLVNDGGWVDVDKYTLQHVKHKNIFSLGDVAGLPTAKTGAAIRKQVPVVVKNLYNIIDSGEITDLAYDGYSSCPLVTAYGKMVLAEFDYDNNFTPDPKLKQMLVFDSSKEHWRLWMLKKYGLPYLYWNKMMKGVDV